MATLSLPQLSLSLPNTRMSVDFATFATDLSTLSSLPAVPHHGSHLVNRPLPALRTTVQRRPVPHTFLQEVREEPEPVSAASSRRSSVKRLWRKAKPEPSITSTPSTPALSRANSTASTGSSASTAISSVFSRAQSASTGRSSPASSYRSLPILKESREEPRSLSSLPLSLLEHILSYALELPLTVAVGPTSTEHRHMQYRYNRESLNHQDLQQLMKHPVFLVSHHMRDVALDVFYRKCEFAIDLSSIYYSKVSSTVNSNLKRHRKFWNEAPMAVRESLGNLSRLQIRLPVPSTEAGVRRGREEDDWMDGSDGKGGGGWLVKSMKKEQDDAAEVLKCLETIVELLVATPENAAVGLTRSFTSLPGLRRTASSKSLRSKSAEYDRNRRGSSPDTEGKEGDKKRKPLKRLEIILVKRGPEALVLPDSLGLARALRSVPVTGFLRYYFELNQQKVVWATKCRKRWQGKEPDGQRLLQDLQGLTVAYKPIEPILTPTESKFVKVDRSGRLRLLDSALPKTPIFLETPKAPRRVTSGVPPPPATPKAMRRNPLGKGLFAKKPHKRNDSFGFVIEQEIEEVGSKGRKKAYRHAEPPTVEELQKIAEDIRNGLY